MIKQLKESGRLSTTLLLAGMSVFCFCLSAFRFYVAENKVFLFLNWNLFLAFIPWLTSSFFMLNKKFSKNKIALIPLLVFWLLFFPNSPYILTDLFHLRQRIAVPIWYDLIIILSFAWTGLVFGFISLLDIEVLLSNFLKPKLVNFITILLLFAGSFGIYLGRYLRFNSWDVINDPSPLIYQIGDRIANPLSYPGTWSMTVLFGILLNMMFWTFKLLSADKSVR